MTIAEHVEAVSLAAADLRAKVNALEGAVLEFGGESSPGAAAFLSTALANVQRMLTAATGSYHLAKTGGAIVLNMCRTIESGGVGAPAATHSHGHSH